MDAVGFWGIFVQQTVWEQLVLVCLCGALFGLGQHQAAFIGHDSSHISVFNKWAPDFILTEIYGTFIFGVSSIWWKYTHNVHHVVCNEYDRDPDITHLPFYAVNKTMFLSKSKGKPLGPTGTWLARKMVGLQAITFFPVMVSVARVSMYANYLAMLFGPTGTVPTIPYQKMHLEKKWINFERFCVISHFVVWYFVLTKILSPESAAPFFLGAHHMVGFLHIQLTLSHWDRPTKHSSEDKDNWFVKQTVTGRNIECNIINEWFFGGLHFQIEHHIYVFQ